MFYSLLGRNNPITRISQNYTIEIAHFVARLKDAGPEPVIALITDSADDVAEIAETISERSDEITTYPMWLIGKNKEKLHLTTVIRNSKLLRLD